MTSCSTLSPSHSSARYDGNADELRRLALASPHAPSRAVCALAFRSRDSSTSLYSPIMRRTRSRGSTRRSTGQIQSTTSVPPIEGIDPFDRSMTRLCPLSLSAATQRCPPMPFDAHRRVSQTPCTAKTTPARDGRIPGTSARRRSRRVCWTTSASGERSSCPCHRVPNHTTAHGA